MSKFDGQRMSDEKLVLMYNKAKWIASRKFPNFQWVEGEFPAYVVEKYLKCASGTVDQLLVDFMRSYCNLRKNNVNRREKFQFMNPLKIIPEQREILNELKFHDQVVTENSPLFLSDSDERHAYDRVDYRWTCSHLSGEALYAFLDYYHLGFTHAEISKIVGVTESRTCQIIKDALKVVKSAVDKSLPPRHFDEFDACDVFMGRFPHVSMFAASRMLGQSIPQIVKATKSKYNRKEYSKIFDKLTTQSTGGTSYETEQGITDHR